ncbi:MAG: hypothetical protein IT371_25590 [Deltaproteobacteria bacterium]|nr:hypothetical protein [Deltaproteobacteria bacterium]
MRHRTPRLLRIALATLVLGLAGPAFAGETELARINQWLQEIGVTGPVGVLREGVAISGKRVKEIATANGQKTTRGARGILEGFVSTVQDFARQADRVDNSAGSLTFYRAGVKIGVIKKAFISSPVAADWAAVKANGRGFGVSILPTNVASGSRSLLAVQYAAQAGQKNFEEGRLHVGRSETFAPDGTARGTRAGRAFVKSNAYGPDGYSVRSIAGGRTRVTQPQGYR